MSRPGGGPLGRRVVPGRCAAAAEGGVGGSQVRVLGLQAFVVGVQVGVVGLQAQDPVRCR
jgi:hypothetical protein